MNAREVRATLKKLENPEKGIFLQRFFKTGKGEYAEGDIFLGISVPVSRDIARKYNQLPLSEIEKLLTSKIHEERLVALFILVSQFKKGSPETQRKIYEFYVDHTEYVNNWDLVDSSASYIVGSYLKDKPRDPLYKLVKSKSLWEKRIAIIATHYFIMHLKQHEDTFKISELLLSDTHDLIHKATGWMLREVGKHISPQIEEEFLIKHHNVMPRTMLRYSLEHFSPEKKQLYMNRPGSKKVPS